MVQEIKFGTDGWRAKIAEGYTFANLRRCAQGFASYMLELGNKDEWVIVSHDQRFLGDSFAASVAEVMAGNGINVFLTNGSCPTPVVSYSVIAQNAKGAVNITASHNPPTDNGFKVRDENGGAIAPDGLKKIESLIPDSAEEVKSIPFTTAVEEG
ncbi:MAG: phosphoglucomutase/phosphomannomutase family protein, partial [Anaerolineales bacterium]